MLGRRASAVYGCRHDCRGECGCALQVRRLWRRNLSPLFSNLPLSSTLRLVCRAARLHLAPQWPHLCRRASELGSVTLLPVSNCVRGPNYQHCILLFVAELVRRNDGLDLEKQAKLWSFYRCSMLTCESLFLSNNSLLQSVIIRGLIRRDGILDWSPAFSVWD